MEVVELEMKLHDISCMVVFGAKFFHINNMKLVMFHSTWCVYVYVYVYIYE